MQKTQKLVNVPLSKEAVDCLNPKENSEEPIFTLSTGTSNIERNIEKWMRNAQITKHITYHVARHRAMLRFNATGDKQVLKDLFRQPLKDVSIAPPMHCNYGGGHIRFGHRVFINANCTFQPAGGVEIGDDVYIGSDVNFIPPSTPSTPKKMTRLGSCYSTLVRAAMPLNGLSCQPMQMTMTRHKAVVVQAVLVMVKMVTEKTMAS